MARYKAKWVYGQQCLRKGQVKAECEANTLREFAAALITDYCNSLGDGFSGGTWPDLPAVRDCYGDDLPDWVGEVTAWPAVELSSNCGTTVLSRPTAIEIVNAIRGEDYGDYSLRIAGI